MENELTSQLKTRLTPEEYLLLERAAEGKSEYLDGEMLPMPGASRQHNLITLNIGAGLHRQLRNRPCEVYASDMRVKVSATGLYTYPDVVVVCEEPQFEDARFDTLINPTMLIEVLSESTENYDRGRKFSHYRSVESLKEYVLVAQTERRVEQYVRHSDGKWLYASSGDPSGIIDLTSLGCGLSLADVYHRVRFSS